MSILSSLELDEAFAAACLATAPLSAGSTLVSRATTFDKLSLSDDVDSNATRLTKFYPNAYSDFYPSRTPYVYESGPDWPVRTGPEAQGLVREARPVCRHPIGPNWHSIGTDIYQTLDSKDVIWTSINLLAYANEGEVKPFCAVILSIGVEPFSLSYKDTVAAAALVKNILAAAGFLDIEVAF